MIDPTFTEPSASSEPPARPVPVGGSRRKLWAAVGSATAAAAVAVCVLVIPGTAAAAGPSVAGQASAPLTTSALPAFRPATSPESEVAVERQPAARLCVKLERVAARAHKAETRLGGAATVKGSVNALKARAEAQTKKGHTEAAKKLDARVATRTAGLAKLKVTETGLDALIAANCGK